MTAAQLKLWRWVQGRAAQVRPQIARRLVQAYRVVEQSLSEDDVRALVESGLADDVVDKIASDSALDPVLRGYKVEIDRAVVEASEASGKKWLPVDLGFDITSPHHIEAAETLDTRVMKAVKQEVRGAFKAAIKKAFERSLGPREIVVMLRRSVGISERHVEAVNRFREELESGDRAALQRVLRRGEIHTTSGEVITREKHAGGKGLGRREMEELRSKLGRVPLSEASIDRMVDRYAKRLRAWNVETHSRTAALDAQRAGHRAAWESLVEEGEVSRSMLRRRWLAVGGPQGDGRNRPEHLDLHGTTVGFDEPYSNGEMIPGESTFNCRCAEQIFVSRVLRAPPQPPEPPEPPGPQRPQVARDLVGSARNAVAAVELPQRGKDWEAASAILRGEKSERLLPIRKAMVKAKAAWMREQGVGFHVVEKIQDEWMFDSNFYHPAQWRVWAERRFGARTIYHGPHYLNLHDDLRTKVPRLIRAEEEMTDEVLEALDAEYAWSVAMAERLLGDEPLKVWRGVNNNFFKNRALDVGELPREGTMRTNSLASWTTRQKFAEAWGPWVFETQVDPGDIASLFLNSHEFSPNEYEVVPIGWRDFNYRLYRSDKF